VILRLSSQRGFALIELLAAIVLINVGILAILLALNSGMVTLRRTAERSTASAVADKQMERYRAVLHSSIYLDTSLLAATDSTYQFDSAYSVTQVNQVCSPVVAACTPSQTVTGPDNKSYRIDSYMVSVTPVGGEPVKQVTVVVRKPGSAATLARVVSIFGESF
jgi:Tfp pilus assembly protein PilV